MDFDYLLQEIQLRPMIVKAFMGDAEAIAEFRALIRNSEYEDEAIYLWYLSEKVLRERFEKYVATLEEELAAWEELSATVEENKALELDT